MMNPLLDELVESVRAVTESISDTLIGRQVLVCIRMKYILCT